MLIYIQTKNCLKQQLIAFYGGLQESEKTIGHYCCNMCSAKCICGGTDFNANKEHPLFSLCEEYTDDVNDNRIASMRELVFEGEELFNMLSTSSDFYRCSHDFEESYKTCDIVNSVIKNLPYLLSHDNVVKLYISTRLSAGMLLHFLPIILAKIFHLYSKASACDRTDSSHAKMRHIQRRYFTCE